MKPAAAPHNCYITFIVACLLILVATPGFANNYTVNTTADGRTISNNVIPLRAAILAADAAGGTSTITVPAGTYHLTLGEITFGNNAQNITITGAGAGSTIINMTSTNRDRIFLINPPGTIANVVTTITGISFTNGYLTSDVYGGGAIICGGPGNSTTITNCAFSGNQITKGSAQGGGAVGMQGGGSLFINQCTFSNNASDAAIGGAIGVFLLAADNLTGSVSITNCNFSNNSVTSSVGAGTLGGALAITTQSPNTGQTFPATIQYNTFLNNNLSVTANGGGGGAIYIASSYNTNINYNRFSGNMLGTTQDALCVSQPYGGPTDASNNWWGSNDDPGITNSTPRQTAYIPAGSSGTGTLITTPRLLLTTSVSKSALCEGANTSVATASFLTNSLNTAVSTGNLTQLIGLPISFSVVNGTLSGAQTNIQSTGTATVTFTGNEAAGNCSVDPVVDNVPSTDATAKATVMVSAAPTIASGSQPASQLDCLGSTANFTVTATSIASVTYQWYKNTSVLGNGTTGTGSAISGATSATLSIANPGASDATNYKVVATNICGSVTSNTVALSFYGSRLYVASGSNGDGGSWDSPLGDLTAALSTASSCSGITEIWVKSGTYSPSSIPYNAFSVLTQDKAFTLVSGVAVYGGFAGSETSLSQRNIHANPTILSGGNNCFHVVVSVGNGAGTVFDGFTITNGNADANANDAVFNGQNVSRVCGGGIILVGSTTQISNCTFAGNAATSGGGGLFQTGGTVTVSNCVFNGNSAAYGGAVRTEGTPVFTAVNAVFTANTSAQSAGALSLYQGKDTLVNDLFISNKDNGTAQGGGAVDVNSGAFYFVNNTFYSNTTGGYGGALRSEGTTDVLQVYNNIFYQNNGAKGDNDVNKVTTSYTQSNNTFSTTNPLFTNNTNAIGADGIWGTADDGLHLLASSPGFDEGNAGEIPADVTTDITGAAMVQNGATNMGAYQGSSYLYSTIYVDSSIATAGDGGSWATAFKTMSDAIAVARNATITTMLVAKGTYYPTGSQNGTDRDSAFSIQRGGLKIYGGYPTGGGTRNANANTTILSGNIGAANSSSDNSYHVITITAIPLTQDSLVIDGFTVTAGNASAGSAHTYGTTSMYQGNGAAVYLINNGNAIMFNKVVFSNNSAANAGGGVDVDNSQPVINNCVFTGNSASNTGGGLFTEINATPVIANCVFTGNQSANGGAVYTTQCTTALENCTMYGNSATNLGPATFNTSTANGLMDNCIVWGNSSTSIPIWNVSSTITFNNNIIQGGAHGINSDPLFANTANLIGADNIWGTRDDGLQLTAGSPAIDAGTNSIIQAWDVYDINGATRVINGTVDIGAYEQLGTFNWAGIVSNDWGTAANWNTNVVPTTTDDANITAGTPHDPMITQAAAAHSITNTATLTVAASGSLSISGDINNNGVVNASAGAAIFNGTSLQTITGNITVNNFTVNNPAGVNISSGTTKAYGTYTPTAGTLTTNGNLVLASTANGTASVAQSSISNYVTGNVTVERYIPAHRAWRLLTAPLSNTGTIYQNWQNNGFVTDTTGATIWKPGGTGGTGDGFTAGGGEASIESYDPVANNWVGLNNTTSTLLSGTATSAANTGIGLFVTGPFGSNNIVPTTGATATTLRATGTLQTGTQQFTNTGLTAGTFMLVGNPYASPLNFTHIGATGAASGNISNTMWAWDAQRKGTSYGGYVTFSWDATAGSYDQDIDASQTAQTMAVQSGEAFFVQAVNSGSATVTINETDKAATSAITGGVFGIQPTTTTAQQLRITLSRGTELVDGVLAKFGDVYKTGVSDDVDKLFDYDENLSLRIDANYLAIERRPIPAGGDTIFLDAYAMKKSTTYNFTVNPQGMPSGLQAWLVDGYTNTNTPLSMEGSTSVSFNTGTDPGSLQETRFSIVFQTNGVLATATTLKAVAAAKDVQVEWVTPNELGVKQYQVQRSADAQNFTTINTAAARNSGNKEVYDFTDAQPNAGDNYYRIEISNSDGTVTYSNAVLVKMASGAASFGIYPNPAARNRQLHVQFTNMPAGRYALVLYSTSGKQMIDETITLDGTNTLQTISLPQGIASGSYRVVLLDGKGGEWKQQLIVQ